MSAPSPISALTTRPARWFDRRLAAIAGVLAFAACALIGIALHALSASLPAPRSPPGSAIDLVLIGGLALLAAYNGLSYIPTRQVSYLFYGGLGTALALVYATYFNVSAELFGNLGMLLRTRINHIASGIALALGLGFAVAFLRVHTRRPRVASMGYGATLGLAVGSIVVWPSIDPSAAEVANAATGLLLPPLFVWLGIDAWRAGFRAARFYLAAWSPLLALVVLSALEVVTDRALGGGGRGLLVANLLEMLLLALALTDRVKLAIEARELAHTVEVRALEDELAEVRKLGAYTLLDKIAEGGMGVVYKAKHALLRRPTAIKLIHPRWAGDKALARFEREVQATSRLTHPHTVTIFDYGRTDDGTLYYAMELLDGATLVEMVEVGGPMPPGRVARVIAMVAGALDEAHRAGLIHRDIKPGNILLCRHGGAFDIAKVVDFGLVKEIDPETVSADVSAADHLAGTPLYMAPEQLTEKPKVDARSDLYALGAVAHFLLTGTPLFGKGTVFQIMLRHMRDEPPRPSTILGASIPEDLEALVMELLKKDPDERPRDAGEVQRVAEALASFADWSAADAEEWWAAHETELTALRHRRAREDWDSNRSPLELAIAARPRSA